MVLKKKYFMFLIQIRSYRTFDFNFTKTIILKIFLIFFLMEIFFHGKSIAKILPVSKAMCTKRVILTLIRKNINNKNEVKIDKFIRNLFFVKHPNTYLKTKTTTTKKDG